MSLKKISYELGGTARRFSNEELIPFGADKWDKDKFNKMNDSQKTSFVNKSQLASKKLLNRERGKRIQTGARNGAVAGGATGAIGGGLAGAMYGANKGSGKSALLGLAGGALIGAGVGSVPGALGGGYAVRKNKAV